MYKARLSKIRLNSVLNAIVSDENAIETTLRLQFNSYLYENEYFFQTKFSTVNLCVSFVTIFGCQFYGDVSVPT